MSTRRVRQKCVRRVVAGAGSCPKTWRYNPVERFSKFRDVGEADHSRSAYEVDRKVNVP